MAQRPSETWRSRVADEAARLADGSLTVNKAYAAHLWPKSLVDGVDAVLAAFEAELSALRSPSDKEVFGVVERVVCALNDVNDEQDEMGIETGERELLCGYIDESLTEVGIDVAALTARRGIRRYELTDDWRDW